MNRLAKLHAALSSRVAVRPALEALDGRLELVAGRIQIGHERVSQADTVAQSKERRKYVEGESEEDEDSGSEEVVGLGAADGADEDGETDEDEEEDGDVEMDGVERLVNGKAFLDVEASEDEASGDGDFDSEDDESEDEEEDDDEEEEDEEEDDESD